MSFKVPSSALTVLLFCVASTIAKPVLLAEWQWTDPTGLLHEFNAFGYFHRSWENAAAQVSDNWNLATITSREEQEALICGLQGLRGEFWLGGYQSNRHAGPADDWAWVTGETWNYRNWAPGEPNDYFGCATEQHLAVSSAWGTSQWLWNDEGYLPNIRGFVAERTTESVPEPGQLPLFAVGLIAIASMIRKKKR
jgi:hypothetical protein